jgi:hypothetical protein
LKKNEDITEPETTAEICRNLIKSLDDTSVTLKVQMTDGISGKMLMKELEKSFHSVMVHYLVSRNRPRTRTLHEYRKKGKDLLYQLAFFRNSGIRGIKHLEKELDFITKELGRYHDYAELIKKLTYKYPDPDNVSAMDELAAIIRSEQDKCLSGILPASYKIFFRRGFYFH